MKTKIMAEYGLFLASASVLSYLESLLPAFSAVPGVKIGLANIVTMFFLYRYGAGKAFFFLLGRIFLTGFLFLGISGILYSLSGGVCCIVCMGLAQKTSLFSMAGVSMIGAIAHNAGQLLAAWFVMKNVHILSYFPVLCLSGLFFGLVIGWLGAAIYARLRRYL